MPARNKFTSIANASASEAGRIYNAVDFGAVGDGVTDDWGAIQNAINSVVALGAGCVELPEAVCALSQPLIIPDGAADLTLAGVGKATVLQPLASFTGAAVIVAGGGATGVRRLTLRDFRIAGPSGTYSSNPACDGIQLLSDIEDTVVQNVHFLAINGWAMQVLMGTTGAVGYLCMINCVSKVSKAGYHFQSTQPATARSGGFLISNCVADNCQNGDAWTFDEVTDNVMSNCQGYSQTGSSLHIKGCAFLFVSNCDLGGATPAAPCILVEKGTAHSNDHVVLRNTFAQKGTVGLSITGAAHLRVEACDVYFNQGHGVQINDDSSNGSMLFTGCQFDQNNTSAAASQYDLDNASSHGYIIVRGCHFQSPVGASGTKVAASVASPVFVQGFDVQGCLFSGGSPVTSPALINKSTFRGNQGYNPLGAMSQPGVPASGTAYQNDRTVDCTVRVTCGAGVTVSAIAIGGTVIAGLTVAASSTSGEIRVPNLQTITLTYSGGTPTWQWFGD